MRGRRQNPQHTAAKRNAACPSCGAQAGESCRKTRGGIAWPPHKARIDVALAPRDQRATGEADG